MADFDRAFKYLIGEEGGYVNDPADPGGETKYGISARSYPRVNIRDLTLTDAKAIYKRDFWDPLQLDQRQWGAALCLFDCAVNQGLTRAKALLAQVATSSQPFVVAFQAERALHYASLPTFARFGRGWMRRLLRTTVEAHK